MMSAYFLLLSTLTLVWGAGVNDGQQGGYRDLVCAEDRTVILEVQAGLCPDYRVFSKGWNSPTPSKSLIFWTFPVVLGFFRPSNMGDFSFWYFWDI